MLPSRPSPRSNPGGLPTQPRSRSVGRSRPDEQYRQPSRRPAEPPAPSMRQVRPQRSLASIPNARDRDRAPPVPELRQGPRSRGRPDYEDDYRKRSIDSTSSMSSSASSLLSRMRGRPGDTSSRTSLEEEYEEPPKRGREGGVQSMRSRRPVEDSRSYQDSEPEERDVPASEEGYNIWSRVTGAASTLTVSVSKAWAANIPAYSGEDTPPGQESHLCRAMKAYHLEKARDPTDLPEWLFEPHERRPVGRARAAPSRREEEDRSAAAPRSRGLRDIYESAATLPPARSERSAPRGGYNTAEDSAGPSKATNRLKALRDAKRSAHAHEEPAQVQQETGTGAYGSRERGSADDGGRRPPPRMGLPSGPGVRPRRF
ncbi:hypothetical protein PLICRDRAFT_628937 [Plicaturopsis crispa FD-325 SS-3]|nr:hypothetical protein PLICRDRAFT_628937 [Plicaturopsis crispa FD-325 SS-3]